LNDWNRKWSLVIKTDVKLSSFGWTTQRLKPDRRHRQETGRVQSARIKHHICAMIIQRAWKVLPIFAVTCSTLSQGATIAIAPAILGNCICRLQLHPLFWRLSSGDCIYTRYSSD
jgi:hypothetical protein